MTIKMVIKIYVWLIFDWCRYPLQHNSECIFTGVCERTDVSCAENTYLQGERWCYQGQMSGWGSCQRRTNSVTQRCQIAPLQRWQQDPLSRRRQTRNWGLITMQWVNTKIVPSCQEYLLWIHLTIWHRRSLIMPAISEKRSLSNRYLKVIWLHLLLGK